MLLSGSAATGMLPDAMGVIGKIFKDSQPASWRSKAFDPNQLRDEFGRWATQGGSGKDKDSPTARGGGGLKPAEGQVTKLYADAEAGGTVSVETVMEGLTDAERGAIAGDLTRAARLEAEGKSTWQIHSKDGKGGGGYTEERLETHQEVVEDLLARQNMSLLRAQDPTLIVVGGRGGSGKTTRFALGSSGAAVYDKRKSLYLSADDIKDSLARKDGLPRAGRDAALYHNESTYVLDKVLTYAREQRLPVVLDLTLRNSRVPVVQAFKEAGYKTEAHYMFVDRLEAGRRVVRRALDPKDGRVMPPSAVITSTNNEKNFEDLTKVVDTWSAWDNRVPITEDPIFVAGTKKRMRKDEDVAFLRDKSLGVRNAGEE